MLTLMFHLLRVWQISQLLFLIIKLVLRWLRFLLRLKLLLPALLPALWLKLPTSMPQRVLSPLRLLHVLLSVRLLIIIRLNNVVRILVLRSMVFLMPSLEVLQVLSSDFDRLFIRMDILYLEITGRRIGADSVVFRIYSALKRRLSA